MSDDRLHKCVGKERFNSHAMAERVAKLSMQRRGGPSRHPYKCEHCGLYHVGSELAAVRKEEFRRERENLRLSDMDLA